MKIDRDVIYNKFNGKCAYCGTDITKKQMQVDHIVSKRFYKISKIKPDLDKDDNSNLNPSCSQCNYYKGCKSIDGFRKHLKNIHKRLVKDFKIKLSLKYNMIDFKQWDGIFYFEKINKNDTLLG